MDFFLKPQISYSKILLFNFLIFYCFSSSPKLNQVESSEQGCCNLDIMCIKTAQ